MLENEDLNKKFNDIIYNSNLSWLKLDLEIDVKKNLE